jgi:phage terminase Nu1 subunit (DNA packaging protein)
LPDRTYTATDLAKILDLSHARIGQLAKSGLLKKRNGKYGSDAITAYIAHLRERANRTTSYTEQIDAEKARKLKRENDEAEGLVAPVALLTEALEKIAVQVVPILEGIPLTLKRQLPSLTGDEVQTMRAAIAEARNVIAETKIEP